MLKAIYSKLRRDWVQVTNLAQFVELALRNGTPPGLWPAAWRGCQEDHEAEIRKYIFQLRQEGKVRQDEEGRLYWIGDDDES